MIYNIVLCGVGGQGVLSLAAVIAQAAMAEGLEVRQSEVHGMSQRGGAVTAHLRMANEPLYSDIVPKGRADLILSMEPLESLRYLDYLGPNGLVVTAKDPVINIKNYPELDAIIAALKALPRVKVVDAAALAKQAGNPKAVNMVLVGAAQSGLPVKGSTLEEAICKNFAHKGEDTVKINIAAFEAGRGA
jgi:indolepyruvate ferredoxin oxidoreductase beta subunit